MKRTFFIVLLFLGALTGPFAFAEDGWKEVRVGKISYVTFDSFCKFYGFISPRNIGVQPFEIKGPRGSMIFRADSREFWHNGLRYWLSFPTCMQEDGTFLLPKIDLIKTFDVILRPETVRDGGKIVGVVIDPGHGGSDKGTMGRNGLKEKDINLTIAWLLRKELERDGIPCVMTREKDADMSLGERTRFAAHYPHYLFLSIHHNEGDRSSRGIETYCLTPPYAPSTSEAGRSRSSDARVYEGNLHDNANMLLASLIHRELMQLHAQAADRGLKRARFMVLKEASIPAALVEVGFLSNGEESILIGSQKYRQAITERLAAAVQRFMGKLPQEEARLVSRDELKQNLRYGGIQLRPPARAAKEPIGVVSIEPSSLRRAGMTTQ
ncbi:MAG: N-acetylmuramoyl-L-alanine amidase [bacterium]